MNSAAINLLHEQARSERYWDRMKRTESNLAYIREALGVTGRPNRVTLQRIEDLQDLARAWVLYTDSLS